LHEKLIS